MSNFDDYQRYMLSIQAPQAPAEPKIERLDFEDWPPSNPTLQPRWDADNYEVAEAWARHEREHDPPGMWIGFRLVSGPVDQSGERQVVLKIGVAERVSRCGRSILPCSGAVVSFDSWQIAGRAVAWPWYKRRLAQQVRFDKLLSMPAWMRSQLQDEKRLLVWPRCLLWSDEVTAEVEAWEPDRQNPLPDGLR